MNLYFACSPSRTHLKVLQESKAQNLLFSYAFIKNPAKLLNLLGEYRPKRIILDSGAFSVWSNGGQISLTDYGTFASQFRDILPKDIELNVVNLDVLPGQWGYVPTKEEISTSAEQGWSNMEYLESKGLKVIHIFHQHEDFAILERLTQHSDYIGISPANDVSMEEKLEWLNKVFFKIKSTVKTHGFAVTSEKQLYGYPFYSVDSSSWVVPARYGRLAVFTDEGKMRTFSYKNKDGVEKYWKYISYMGIDKIASNISWHDRVTIAINSYQKLEQAATKLWESRKVIWDSVDNLVVDLPVRT